MVPLPAGRGLIHNKPRLMLMTRMGIGRRPGHTHPPRHAYRRLFHARTADACCSPARGAAGGASLVLRGPRRGRLTRLSLACWGYSQSCHARRFIMASAFRINSNYDPKCTSFFFQRRTAEIWPCLLFLEPKLDGCS